MTGATGDELTAASLLVASISVLFGVWYAELRSAQNITVPPNVSNRAPAIQSIRMTLLWRALPLMCGAGLTALLLAPVVMRVIRVSWRALNEDGSVHYDAVSAVMVGSWVILVGLMLVISREYFALHRKYMKARGK